MTMQTGTLLRPPSTQTRVRVAGVELASSKSVPPGQPAETRPHSELSAASHSHHRHGKTPTSKASGKGTKTGTLCHPRGYVPVDRKGKTLITSKSNPYS